MPQLLEVGREPPSRLSPLNDVGPLPHPTDCQLSDGSRKPDLPSELVRSLSADAEQSGDLRGAQQVHIVEATAHTHCAGARLVVLSSKQDECEWPRRWWNTPGPGQDGGTRHDGP